MSLFTIFAILLTIAYAIGYVTMIIMDVTAKPNNDEQQSVSIAIGEQHEQHTEEDFATRTVKENSSGGFDFVDKTRKAEETPIEEAEETKQNIEEKKEASSSESNPSSEPSEPEPDKEEQNAPSPETAPEESDVANEPDSTKEDNPEEDLHEEVNEDEETDNSNITIVDFSEAHKQEEKPSEPFDESQFFDQDKLHPQYGVSQVIEPKPDNAVQKLADRLTSKLEPTSIKEKMMSQQTLLAQLKSKNNETNIEHQNEYVNM